MIERDLQPLVSVVIPVYNGEKTLMGSLESVLNQKYTYMEIIIVDDGSDNPVELFLQPMIADPRIRIIRTARSNANIARNCGIKESKGDFIAMLDADDIWLENHIIDCLGIMQKSNADGLYGSLFLHHPQSVDMTQLPIFYAREVREGESIIDYVLSAGKGAQTSTLFTTAHSMKDVLWNPELIDHQDFDFIVRFSKKYKMTVKKEPTVVYNLTSGRAIHYESCIRFVEDNIQDINPEVYMSYNLGMYMRADQKAENKSFILYFHKEAVRFKEYISYQHFISICNPRSRVQEWIHKLKYIVSVSAMPS